KSSQRVREGGHELVKVAWHGNLVVQSCTLWVLLTAERIDVVERDLANRLVPEAHVVFLPRSMPEVRHATRLRLDSRENGVRPWRRALASHPPRGVWSVQAACCRLHRISWG